MNNLTGDELLDQLLAFRAQLMLEDSISDQLYGNLDRMSVWRWYVRLCTCCLRRHRWQAVPGQQVLLVRYCDRCFESHETPFGRQMIAGEQAELRYRSRRSSTGRLGALLGAVVFDLVVGTPLNLVLVLVHRHGFWLSLAVNIVLGLVGAVVGTGVEERLRRWRRGSGA